MPGGWGLFIITGESLDDGVWLSDYDPDANDGIGAVWGSDDPEEAMRFEDAAACLTCWQMPSVVRPLRSDGKPNRPLSAFTVTPKPLP